MHAASVAVALVGLLWVAQPAKALDSPSDFACTNMQMEMPGENPIGPGSGTAQCTTHDGAASFPVDLEYDAVADCATGGEPGVAVRWTGSLRWTPDPANGYVSYVTTAVFTIADDSAGVIPPRPHEAKIALASGQTGRGVITISTSIFESGERYCAYEAGQPSARLTGGSFAGAGESTACATYPTTDPLRCVVATSPPASTSAPELRDGTVEGDALRTTDGTWNYDGPMAFQYQWHRCAASGTGCVAIPGQVSRSYVLTAADVGSTIRSSVRATNSAGTSSEAFSAPSAVIQTPPPPPPPAEVADQKTCTASSVVDGVDPTTDMSEDCDSSNEVIEGITEPEYNPVDPSLNDPPDDPPDHIGLAKYLECHPDTCHMRLTYWCGRGPDGRGPGICPENRVWFDSVPHTSNWTYIEGQLTKPRAKARLCLRFRRVNTHDVRKKACGSGSAWKYGGFTKYSYYGQIAHFSGRDHNKEAFGEYCANCD